MSRPLFLPTMRQSAWLAAIALAALSCSFYLRYQVIEQTSIGIACGDNPTTWDKLKCFMRGYDKIEEIAAAAPRPFIYHLNYNNLLMRVQIP